MFILRLVVVVVMVVASAAAAAVVVVTSFHLGNKRPNIFSCFTPH
jgi:hypothetical protein